jgi:hypothetical protein
LRDLITFLHSEFLHSFMTWCNIWQIKNHSSFPISPWSQSKQPEYLRQTSFKFPLYDTMAVYSKQSFFKCLQTIFPCLFMLFRGFFTSDLDYNISYTDPSYLEQNSGRWKMPSKVGNIALRVTIQMFTIIYCFISFIHAVLLFNIVLLFI